MLLTACNRHKETSVETDNRTALRNDSLEIGNLVKKYAESITNADSALGSTLFMHTGEVSFIHPRGHERGWTQIKDSIYKFFDNMFINRDLRTYDEHITVYNQTVWVEFYWEFNANFKTDHTPVQSRGRETQIWRKSNGQWHIVHVHYSNMPVTGK
jgi:ketosteroid isomerase-like protein